MRLLAILALLLSPAVIAQSPEQTPAQSQPAQTPPISDTNPSATISVRSSLVVVPALVKTKSGQLVFTLKADDFTVKDDGIPQKLQIEEDTDSQPLALVIVVEVGGDGIRYLDEYSDLGPLLDAIIGNVPHRVALVDFDSDPELLHGFTSDLSKIVTELNRIESGDNGASVLDAMSFAVKLLREQPPTYRRAILLISETLDQGSHIDLTEALHELSDTNTSIYALSFPSTKTEIKSEAHKLGYNGAASASSRPGARLLQPRPQRPAAHHRKPRPAGLRLPRRTASSPPPRSHGRNRHTQQSSQKCPRNMRSSQRRRVLQLQGPEVSAPRSLHHQ